MPINFDPDTTPRNQLSGNPPTKPCWNPISLAIIPNYSLL